MEDKTVTSLKIAWRFLKHSKMYTLVIILGIAIGVPVQMFIGLLSKGLEAILLNSLIDIKASTLSSLDKPTSGQVYIEVNRTDKMSRRALASLRNKKIGSVFQFCYLLTEFNILESVLMPYTIRRIFHGRKTGEKAENFLDMVGLLNYKKMKDWLYKSVLLI